MSSSAPFALFTAFTSNPFGGNPAAVVFLDVVSTPLHVLQGLAKNFNQPMTAFIQPPTAQSILHHPIADDGAENGTVTVTVRTRIRYVTYHGVEVGLCGHASICAASAIVSLPQFQLSLLTPREGAKGKKVGIVEFEAMLAKRVVPVRVLEDGGYLELGLPSAPGVKPSEEERVRLEGVVQRAFQGSGSGKEVVIGEVLVGTGDFSHALLVELGPEADLANANVDVSVFANSGYSQNILTSLPSSSSSSSGDVGYIHRIFTPYVPGGEDPVCGSAQCLLAPFWCYTKRGVIEKGKEVATVAASSRGGCVGVRLEEDKVFLRGQSRMLGSGVCYF